ncbi:MAG: hypothetical protein ACEPOZ_13900 [Marinifilaceae bacterium]
MKLKLILSVAVLLFFQKFGMAQNQSEVSFSNDSLDFIGQLEQSVDSLGKISIYQDERIRELLKTDKEINSTNPGFTGYRIQIFSGRSFDKKKAISVKEEFEELFPDVRAYLIYQAPDFRVRVGNFRSKLESIHLYKTVKKHYPHCYPVKTRILFSELVPIEKEEVEVDTITEQE